MRNWTRRRFIAVLGGLFGTGALGAAAWRNNAPGAAVKNPVAGGASPTSGAALGSSGGATTTSTAAATTSAVTSSTEAATTTTGTPTTAAATSTTAPTTAPPTTAPPTTTTGPPTTTAPATTLPPSTTTSAPGGGVAASTRLICKDAWGARPVAGAFVPHEIERLTVHHTAVVLGSNTQAPGRARQHQRYHQDQGWPDLAYHFLVDAHGFVYEGRPPSARGDTFTSYDPAGHFLVCAEGNFDEQSLPEAQVAAMVEVLAWGAVTFGVAPSTIGGHRDYAGTTCPGDALYALIRSGELESRVAERAASGAVALPTVCGPDGEALVADIEAGRI